MRPNSWTWFGQKSFPFCSSQWALLTDLPPSPLEQKWFETGLQCKHRVRKPQVWELSKLCPKTSTKLYIHEFGFCTLTESLWRNAQIDSAKNVFHIPQAKECIEVIHKMIVTHIPRDDNTVQKNAGKKCTGRHHYIIQIKKRTSK
jgi:hypothetical protein